MFICWTICLTISMAAMTSFQRWPSNAVMAIAKTVAEEMKPIGETEFLERMARRAASDGAIKTRVAAAIVGFADLTLGDEVAPVLEAHVAASPSRFRGIRHSTTWDGSGALRNEAAPGLLGDDKFRGGFAQPRQTWLELRCLGVSSTA